MGVGGGGPDPLDPPLDPPLDHHCNPVLAGGQKSRLARWLKYCKYQASSECLQTQPSQHQRKANGVCSIPLACMFY